MIRRLFLLLLLGAGTLTAARARESYPLNDGWHFFFSHENSGERARSVTLPHTWNNDALAGVYPYLRTQAVYTRSLYLPGEWRGKRLFLRFAGVENTADVLINGSCAGSHTGGGTAFTFEITDLVRYGDKNSLMVAVCNAPRSDLMTAEGRNVYGGIVRGVELLVTDRVAVSPLYLGTDGVLIRPGSVSKERAEGELELHLSIPSPQAVAVTVRAYDEADNLVFEQHRALKNSYDTTKSLVIPFAVDRPALWSPGNPALYRFVTEVTADGSRDEVSVVTGLRSVKLTPSGLLLNGERVAVHGLSLAYESPLTGGLQSAAQYDADLALAVDVGANAVRSPSGPHAAALYDGCDRLGLLAWIDLPFGRSGFLSDLSYFVTPGFEQQGEQLLQEIIAQQINHPSVICWGLFTDLPGIDRNLLTYVERLRNTARALDPSRPTVATSNRDGRINFLTDGIVWHQQAGWERGLTEDIGRWIEQLRAKWGHLASAIFYGAEGFTDQQPDTYDKPAAGTLDLPERRQSRFHEEYHRQLAADSTVLWGHWIEGLTDYAVARREEGRNGSGLVGFDRTTRKDAYYLYRAWWNDREQTLRIADSRWKQRPLAPQQITVYASATLDPVLEIDGEHVPLERWAPCVFKSAEWTPAGAGPCEIVVRADSLEERMVIEFGSALTPPVQPAPLQTISRLRRD